MLVGSAGQQGWSKAFVEELGELGDDEVGARYLCLAAGKDTKLGLGH